MSDAHEKGLKKDLEHLTSVVLSIQLYLAIEQSIGTDPFSIFPETWKAISGKL